jgi:CRP/FNR family transcriptional regulator/CRP/FNR family cyclic AMP-dependent transcriptional regulator
MKDYSFLKSVNLFSGLADKERQRLGKKFKHKKVGKEEFILMVEDTGSSFYVISSGKVKISVLSKDGREIIFGTLGKGDFFGEMSLLDGKKRSANVVALEDTDLWGLHREDFLATLEKNPQIATAIMGELTRRIRRADQQIKSLALLDVYGRVAGTLMHLAEDHGIKVPDGILIEKRPSHQEIANMAGTSRETVTRVLGDLKGKGLIDMDDQSLLIRNEQRLGENYVV